MYRKDATYSINGACQPITTAKCQAQNNTSQVQMQLLDNMAEVLIVSSLCNKSSPGSPLHSIQPAQYDNWLCG